MRHPARFGAALALVLLGGLLVAPATPAAAAPTFTDVSGSAFGADIDWLVAQGITAGYPDHTFRPTGAVTRQAFAAFLFRLDGQTGGGPCTTGAPFPDVPAASTFCTEITWLVAKKVTSGYADGGFHPAATISRQAIAAFLYRYDRAATGAANAEGPCASPSTFTDIASSLGFCEEIRWMSTAGTTPVTTGYPDHTFRPTDNASRQAIAAWLHRYRTNTPARFDRLLAGQVLSNGSALTSPDKQYTLAMQSDGNLVEYFQGRSVWNSHSAGATNTHLAMQADGNLVLYSGSQAIWDSQTENTGAQEFDIQSDGNLVVYNGSTPQWNSGTHIDTLQSGQSIGVGQYLISADGAYEFVVQADGNAVIYRTGSVATWSSDTAGTSNPAFYLQGDGNVVLYGPSGAVWDAGTAGLPGVELVMQSDGNLALYDASHTAVWSTGGGLAHPPATSAQTHAVAWALSQVGSSTYPGLCELFVERAYGTSGKYSSALTAFKSLQSAGAMHYTTSNIPTGALVFSEYAPWDFGDGHVELSEGNGSYVSGGALTKTSSTVETYTGLSKGFLGWAMPPTSWPGR